MVKGEWKGVLYLSAVLTVMILLSGCATPKPDKEMADAEAAIKAAKAAGAPQCGAEELAAAESAFEKGRALAQEFCHELEARRMLVDAKVKADEARLKCMTPPPPPPPAPAADLKDIFFDFDKAVIRPDAAEVLKENAELLKENPSWKVVVEGYADVRGSDAYNLRLAQRRADATKAYLVKLGVAADRIEAVGKGETSKFAAGSTVQAFQLNRRSHFIVMSGGSAPGARLIIIKE